MTNIKAINKVKRFLISFLLVVVFKGLPVQGQTEIPKLIADASPEAASLGQYGDVPVNLAIGQINYTIPLYTIKIGDFDFPLTLSYAYSGFRPNSDPSMTGMGWTANIGGAVVRQVKGGPDDFIGEDWRGYQYCSETIDKLENYNSLPVDEKVTLLQTAADGGLDLLPDVFVINTPTLGGSFRIKCDKSVVFKEKRNYNVTVNGSGFNSFSIVDDKGVTYLFDTKEKTQIMTSTEGVPNGPEPIDYTSSWMLSRIDLPNSDRHLIFTYKDVHFQNDNYTTNLYWSIDGWGAGGTSHIRHSSKSSIAAKVLSRIDIPGIGYIIFNTGVDPFTVQGATYEGTYYQFNTNRVKLNSMSVYDESDRLVTKYIFDFFDTGYYFFLNSIKKEDRNGLQEDYYSFDYYNLALVPANKVSNNKTDMWGFYNGINYDESDIPTSLKSSFSKGRIGALEQITYPTKGTTDITYEAHDVKREGSFLESFYGVFDIQDGLYDMMNADEDNEDYSVRTKVINISYDQDVEVTLDVDVTPENSISACYLKRSDGTIVHYYDDYGHEKFVTLTAYEDQLDPGESRHKTETHNFRLTKGDYTLYTMVESGGEDGNTAMITISYRSEPYSQDPVNYKINVGGIRVSKTEDDPGDGSPTIIRDYKYVDDNNQTSGRLVDYDIRFRGRKTTKTISQALSVELMPNGEVFAFGWDNNACPMHTESSVSFEESLYPMSPMTSLGSQITYGQVEITANNGANGKSVQRFTETSSFSPSDIFPDLIPDYEYMECKKYYDAQYKQNEIIPTKKQEQYYEDHTFDQTNYIPEYQVVRYPNISRVNRCYTKSYELVSTPPSFQIGSLEHYTNVSRPARTTTTDIELVGEGSGQDEYDITTTTDYSYDASTGYQTAAVTTNSDNTTTTIRHYYPNQVGQLSGFSAAELSAIDALKNQNRLSVPLQTEKLVKAQDNSVLAKTTQRTTYKDWGNGVIAPEHVQTAINDNTLENRVVYYKYDGEGNPLEVGKADDNHISYIWGYNNTYPVLKIVGISYSDLQSNYQSVIDYLHDATHLPTASDYASVKLKVDAIKTFLSTLMQNSNYKVSIYTYEPLVGKTSETAPNGLTTYYVYNAQGRLQCIKDNDGNILKQYDYHYKGQ